LRAAAAEVQDAFMELPETRYTRTPDGTHIAYQVLGEGPVDLVYMAPWFSHLEIQWQHPAYARFLRRLASFSRLVMFDRRGSGLSDPVPVDRPPDLETRMDDARVVMDAVASERAVVYGASESGAMAALFAASHPDRTIALVIHGSNARSAWAPDYPWGETPEEHQAYVEATDRSWGTEDFVRTQWPSLAQDAELVQWLTSFSRHAMSPGAAVAYEEMYWRIDVRQALPAIHVPTMILHRRQDEPEANRYLAEHIAGAEYVQLPGDEHIPFLGDQDSVTNEIERFVQSVREEESVLDRVLATVLFTDIVGSTESATRMGDRGWGEVVERHHAAVRGLLGRYRGNEVDTAGDGFFATFDGPARAVKCAQSIVEAVRLLGLEVRAGVHTGEVETIAGKAGGLAVVIGSRVGAMAKASEVLASQTVKDLTAGSGLMFEDAGEHELKGVPNSTPGARGWRLWRVIG
jgi:pimeloyl-ACP methyl ester carboxylesterase/class 3 adenylate cyclase